MKEHWCILRTGGKRTLRLADSLLDHGIEAWTPKETRKLRLPRTREVTHRTLPIMPTFVFARARHLPDLAAIARDYRSPHPGFSIQLYQNEYPLIAGSELRALRDAERRSIPLEQVSPFQTGEHVRMTDGGFSGLTGIVERSDGKHTMICFPGSKLSVKISTLLLRQEYATDEQIAA
jgi:hypothetical protein